MHDGDGDGDDVGDDQVYESSKRTVLRGGCSLSLVHTQCVLHMVMVSYTHPNIKAQKQTKCIFPLLDPEPRSAAVFALGNRQVGKDQDFDDLLTFCKGRPCHISHAKETMS